jgi:hypothetical protein
LIAAAGQPGRNSRSLAHTPNRSFAAFFGLTVASLFVFRRVIPLDQRPAGTYATPLYPILPALFCAAAVLVVGSVLWSAPGRSMIGLALLATGVPAWLYWKSRDR